MSKLSIFIILALVVMFGSAFAQTSEVSIGTVTGSLSDDQLIAGADIAIEIVYDGTGLRAYEPGSPPTHGNWIYTNGFLMHGDAEWGGITSQRLPDAQRLFVETPGGPMNFTTGIVNSWWYKAGNSGDPTFGTPGAAHGEATGTTFSGPSTGNTNGNDTVGVLVGLTGTAADDGWNTVTHPVSSRYEFQFSTLEADTGKMICIDSVTTPLAAWEWVAGVDLVVPTYDNGLGGLGTRCWTVTDSTTTAISPLSDLGIPADFALEQNYPNPFNPTTNIRFDVPRRTNVNISIFNVLGQKVRNLVNQDFAPGTYEVDWDGESDGGSRVASGIYFYRFTAEDVVKTRKMLMLK